MGCFLGCFKGPKVRKRRRSPRRSPSLERRVSESCQQLIPSAKQISPDPSAPELLPPEEEVSVAVTLPEKKENAEKGNAGGGRKKVTFDLNIKTYEQVPSDDSEDEEIDEEEKLAEGKKDETYPKSGAFPSNHRYEDCESSDEDDDRGCESGEDGAEFYSDFDEEEEEEKECEIGIQGNEEESYDSFFSLPLDKEPQGLQEEVSSAQLDSASAPLLGKQSIPTAAGSTRDRSQFVHSVLNPVENLSQWKEIKGRAAPAKHPDKQNLGDEQENRTTSIAEPEIKVKKPQVPIFSTKQEVFSVDASLSNWLPSSDNSTAEETPQPSNSHLSNWSLSREDCPILGALTVEDIKQSSMASSPSKSPPAEEIPILGAVGRRRWSCENPGEDTASSCHPSSKLVKGIPNTSSKYREDKAVNWHATPFEVRLERALRDGAASA